MKSNQVCLLALLLSLPAFASAQDSSMQSVSGSCASPEPELADVVKGFSKRTGKKFIVDPRVRAMGGLVGIDACKITYEQLQALAAVHGFVLVSQGDIVIVTIDASARQQPTQVYTDTRFKAADDEWVTLLLTAKNLCAQYAVPILRPLMPQAAHMAADLQSNTLILADRAVNARRIAEVFEKLDKATPPGQQCSAPGAK